MVPVMITARFNSSRLPGKHFLKLGDLYVIEHIIRRCEHFGFKPHLCCPNEDVEGFSGSTSCLDVFGLTTDNVEELLISAAHHFNLTVFHHIDGDDPFFCRDMVVESMQCFRQGKFSRIHPSIYSQSGSGLVGTSFNLSADGREEVLPDPAHAIWPQRLTLDYEEDYHLLAAVNRMVGGYMAPRWAVDQLFERNPDLHKINWFRNAEWKAKQRNEQHRIRL